MDISKVDADTVGGLVTTTDPAFLDYVVRTTAESWGVSRTITLIAAYRMKQLYEGEETRQSAKDKLGHTSWTAWLQANRWPISESLIRTRVLDIERLVRTGVSWPVIADAIQNAPVAAHDFVDKIVNRDGELHPYLDEEALPGGSVAAMLETLAALPSPGHARRLVSEVAGEPQIYCLRAVYASNVLYLTLRYERPGGDQDLYLALRARDRDGNLINLPDQVAQWMADKIGKELEYG